MYPTDLLVLLVEIQVSHDVKVLGSKIKDTYVQHVLQALDPSPGDVLAVVEKSVLQGADLLMEIVPALTDVLTETLADKCVEVSFCADFDLLAGCHHSLPKILYPLHPNFLAQNAVLICHRCFLKIYFEDFYFIDMIHGFDENNRLPPFVMRSNAV